MEGDVRSAIWTTLKAVLPLSLPLAESKGLWTRPLTKEAVKTFLCCTKRSLLKSLPSCEECRWHPATCPKESFTNGRESPRTCEHLTNHFSPSILQFTIILTPFLIPHHLPHKTIRPSLESVEDSVMITVWLHTMWINTSRFGGLIPAFYTITLKKGCTSVSVCLCLCVFLSPCLSMSILCLCVCGWMGG